MSESPRQPNDKKADGTAARPRRSYAWMPDTSTPNTGGTLASALAHALLFLFLFLPGYEAFKTIVNEGAGGPGPAGGGGGGNRGTGGVRDVTERLQYFVQAKVPVPVVVPEEIPPVVEEKQIIPEVVPPPVVTPPETTKADTATKVAEAQSIVAGAGGGSGNDGTAGTGSGTGGGKGTGEGTGTGSGNGPGTGGGTGTVYPPFVTTLVVPPVPVPSRIRPYEMVACFLVDERGKASLLRYTKTRDAGYNRKVEESLQGYRFRPASRIDGVAVSDSVCVTATAR